MGGSMTAARTRLLQQQIRNFAAPSGGAIRRRRWPTATRLRQSWPTRCSPRPQPSGQRGAGQREHGRQLDVLAGAAAGAGAPVLHGRRRHAQQIGGSAAPAGRARADTRGTWPPKDWIFRTLIEVVPSTPSPPAR